MCKLNGRAVNKQAELELNTISHLIISPSVSKARRRTTHCRLFRAAHSSRKLHQHHMPRWCRRHSHHRRMLLTQLQRQRQRLTMASIRWSRPVSHGRRTVARRKKVSEFIFLSFVKFETLQLNTQWNFNLLFLDNFYSSSDSDSDEEIERKIHVEIKPLNNGQPPISASVDELRATVENLSLSPIGALSVRHICRLSGYFSGSTDSEVFFITYIFLRLQITRQHVWHPWRNWFYSKLIFLNFFSSFSCFTNPSFGFRFRFIDSKIVFCACDWKTSLTRWISNSIQIDTKFASECCVVAYLKTQSHSLEYQFIQRAKKFTKRSSWSHEEISINVTANRRKGQHEWHNES